MGRDWVGMGVWILGRGGGGDGDKKMVISRLLLENRESGWFGGFDSYESIKHG